eukprot:5219144-Pleurochrysis_carterae.AAC.1
MQWKQTFETQCRAKQQVTTFAVFEASRSCAESTSQWGEITETVLVVTQANASSINAISLLFFYVLCQMKYVELLAF